MDIIYLDTEYRDDAVILACLHIPEQGTADFDLRTSDGIDSLRATVEDCKNYVWCGYAIHAELTSMLRLDIPVADLMVIDLMAECRMITLTHSKYFAPSASLVDSLKAFGLNHFIPEAKNDTRDLILNNKEYSEEEWSRIVRYCRQDTECLPHLWKSVQDVHSDAQSPLWLGSDLEDCTALYRGDYVKATAISDYNTRGFPIDEPWLQDLMNNRKTIVNRLSEDLNERYDRQLFRWNKKEDRYSRYQMGIHLWINSLKKQYGLPWERTEKETTYRTDDEYLKKMIARCPEISDFREGLKSIQALRMKTDLRDLMVNGYIKAPTFAYRAMTGRNGPAPKRGFILGLPKWMRSLIRPHPGMAFVSADWSQQEIALAAVLSGDNNLMEVYNSGDCYLALAKRGGAVPVDGTKATHPVERQMYKAVQLGIGYGKGLESLIEAVYDSARNESGNHLMTLEEADSIASEIWSWHKEEFSVYWKWIDNTIYSAYQVGWWTTISNDWIYFVDRKSTRKTQLLNLPMQAHGAVLMRWASILAVEAGLDLVASQHDSLYVNCPVEECDVVAAVLKDCMDAAVGKLFRGDVNIRVDTHLYTHDAPYRDDTATQTYNKIRNLVYS